MTGFNASEWAVKHPSFVLFLIVACGLAGFSAYLGMGRAEDPAFTIKVLVVSAQWPGATADEMQRQVADKIEEKLQETPHLDTIKTYCTPGGAFLTLQLKDTTPPKDVPDAWYQVRKKVGDMRFTLPQGVLGPFVDFHKKIERVDHRHIGNHFHFNTECPGFVGKNHPGQNIAERVLLPIDKVVFRLNVQAVADNRCPAMHGGAQPEHMRRQRHRPVEVISGFVVDGHSNSHNFASSSIAIKLIFFASSYCLN